MKQVKEVNVHNAVFLYSFSISIVEKLKSWKVEKLKSWKNADVEPMALGHVTVLYVSRG